MSWAPDSPVELADGRLVCGTHSLVVYGRCCVDYSFMDDVVDEDSIEGRVRLPEEYEDDLDHAGSLDIERLDPIRRMEMSIGRGSVLPTVFVPPPSATPQSLFPAGDSRKAHPPVARFIRVDDPKSFLIYTDGACLGNGQVEPKGGWAFVFGPQERNTTSSVNERLENQGPLGDYAHPTSHRAELRAIIGALRYRNWASEGFTTLVLATDSEYVVKGATEWIRAWLRRGWRKSDGAVVRNVEMWQAFLGEVERWDEYAVKIQLWKIPREWNTEADRLAKEGAQLHEELTYKERLGISP
ncbi:ribonuclease H [Fusarium subglutinans]|uniref:ribonuclease H n=1 Tax=Gibberella subglutinans TaxID=42677 RepID=A0A8H5PG34_GIBSU|nr:ribonuclease H [Fusarium subglutinans]KAF5596049.1 ribonuclease H [Fusarium subglutinans]